MEGYLKLSKEEYEVKTGTWMPRKKYISIEDDHMGVRRKNKTKKYFFHNIYSWKGDKQELVVNYIIDGKIKLRQYKTSKGKVISDKLMSSILRYMENNSLFL